MTALRSSRAEKALTLFANIPETVLTTLVSDPDYRAAIIERLLPFSDAVFTQLWKEVCAANGKDALALVGRHLSPTQRHLVLSNDTREILLSSVLDCNVLTAAELDLVLAMRHPTYAFGTQISENLFNYYFHDEVLFAKLMPHLDAHYHMRARLRSATSTDAEALSALNRWVELLNTREDTEAQPGVFITDLEDMLYHRPHLASKVATFVNGYVHYTLSGSRYAANPGVLRILCDEHDYKATYILGASARVHIDTAVSTNVYLPAALRAWEKLEDTSCAPPVPADLQTLSNPVHLDKALRYALASHNPFTKRSRSAPWEIYDLALNDNVAGRRDPDGTLWDGRLLLSLVNFPHTTRLGPERVARAMSAILARFDAKAESKNYPFPLPLDYVVPRSPRYATASTTGDIVPVEMTDEIDDLVTAGGYHLDVTPLLPFLGESPSKWHGFLRYLNTADPSTTVAALAATVARAASVLTSV